jgi:hypothetical protein
MGRIKEMRDLLFADDLSVLNEAVERLKALYADTLHDYSGSGEIRICFSDDRPYEIYAEDVHGDATEMPLY